MLWGFGRFRRKGGASVGYNVGDKVRVRSDLLGGKTYGGVYMNPEMEIYRGCVFSVLRPSGFGCKLADCIDNETAVAWDWSDEMLEPVAVCPRESRLTSGTAGDAFQGHWHHVYTPVKSVIKIGELREMTVAGRRITLSPNEIESRKEIRKRLLKL
jgi:hypothetical protein